MLVITLSVLVQASLCSGTSNEGFSQLHGHVYDAVDRERPISYSWISIYDDGSLVSRGVTGSNGSYSFELRSGKYTIKVEKPGYISQTAFAILEPDSALEIDLYLEMRFSPYEALIMIEGLPEGLYPEIRLDNSFHGYGLNGTRFSFRENTSHIVELGEVTDGQVRYVHVNDSAHIFTKAETRIFQYLRQFYINSSTDQWINGWYDEGIVSLEATKVIDLGNGTRLIFDSWLKDGKILRDNPVRLRVNSSFQLDTEYRRRFLLKLSSDMGVVEGGGWYDEGSIARISVKDTTLGVGPFAYRFAGWRGDLESQNAMATTLMDKPKEVYAEWRRVEVVKIEKLDPIYKAIINISLLVFAAKILSGLFAKVGLPEVLGELSAGMILGPYALGGITVLGEPIMEINEYIRVFAEVGAILLLFIAGLEVSFARFKAVGAKSSVVGSFGVILPFFLGLYTLQFLGFPWEGNLLVAATLTATSIAITARTLEDLGRLNTIEGNLIINAAVIDDVLGLVVLAVVMSVVTSGVPPRPFEIAWLLFRTIAFWLLLLASTLTVAPRLVRVAEWWKARGTVEVFATATCFGSAVAAAAIGLSPIVGAFAAGMAIASSRVIARVRDYIEMLSILFSPIFFAFIGAQFNVNALSVEGIWLILILTGVAVTSKLVGCGIPATMALKNSRHGFRVGIGMISRGEVGLIIAGIGVTSGIITQGLYGAVVSTVIITTLVTPIALRWAYAGKSHLTSQDLDERRV